MNTSTRVLLVSLLSVAALAGCSKKVKEAPVADTTPTTPTAPVATDDGVYGPEDLDTDACLRQRVIHFDFDQYTVKPEYQAVVACHAKYLRDRPSSRQNLEGHTDERGSREYNMGLGERRGNAVSSALQGAGASATQLTVVSYGEERPVCTESTEACWAQNRRVEIVYSAR
ncbi:peptidoglycan-associated lipoprotein Pal [Pseudoxanthomonas daejeonensis]|uniref:Peptidoglycan-associated lipoprotein n=1 Tax=Pseudoxanthomonas daejeonensis TaxID=266062 RepID=A0ABQ6ZAG2_9GAMM|nr:peptidoglycan-associated lipoprotein Pal [Pseudoxanthomonas daejeonensis]KAF1696862.1 peptidoglycan-associated lipoprotein [Pseudoxanthomonas daejeonensis]UNK56539.1 peptidoglycan-associated lipoprotein Pal [Pseudoxanthomonas daejeonensis]